MKKFHNLIEDRKKNAEILNKPSLRGIWKSVVDKYSEKAHFIYELLQNADDVKATYVKFILDNDGLIFVHNGKIKFNVSVAETEQEDKINNKLGHINAITSIGNSGKTAYQIGKFGVGFKAVFQYCDCPEIYENKFKFKIENYIVPVKLKGDFKKYKREKNDKKEETLFYFPFRENMLKTAFNDINEKITSLKNPLLFIYNIKNIEWSVNKELSGNYHIKGEEPEFINDIKIQKIQQFTKLSNKKNPTVQNLILFTKKVKKQKQEFDYTIAFLLKKNRINQLIVDYENDQYLYCYFPTREITKLKFIIHAPFELVESRESIKKNKLNEELISLLANLTADSLQIFRAKKLLTNDFFNVLPINKEDFENTFYYNFFDKVLEKLKSKEKLLPTKEGDYTDFGDNYIFENEKLLKLFNSEQLSFFINSYLDSNKSVKIIFPNVFNATGRKIDLDKYVYKYLVERELTPKNIVDQITYRFIEKQNDAWLIKFYETFSATRNLLNNLRYKAIVRTESNKIVVPYNVNKELQVFLSSKIKIKSKNRRIYSDENKNIEYIESINNNELEEKDDFLYVKKIFIDDKISYNFLKELGLKEPDLISEIEIKILPIYKNENKIDNSLLLSHFEKFYKYFKKCPEHELFKFIQKINDINFIVVYNPFVKKHYRQQANNIYLQTKELKTFFNGYNNESNLLYWFNDSYYDDLYKKYSKEDIYYFLKKIGVKDKPRILQIKGQLPDNIIIKKIKKNTPNAKNWYNVRDIDKKIQGLDNTIHNINFEKSIIIWNSLINKINGFNSWEIKEFFNANLKYEWHGLKTVYYKSLFLTKLQNNPWLYNKDNKLVGPSEILKTELSQKYNKEHAGELIKYLNFKKPEIKEWQKEWTEDEKKEKYDIWLKAKNYSSEDFEKLEKAKTKRQLIASLSNKNEEESNANRQAAIEDINKEEIFNLEKIQNVALKFAHIFKYPLGEIKKIAESFEPSYPYQQTPEELKEGTIEINYFVKKLDKAVDFILTLSPGNKIKIKQINISEIIYNSFNNSFKNKLENNNIKTIINIPDNILINYYREYFEDIISNLIDNSIKALFYKEQESEFDFEKIIKCDGSVEDNNFIILFSDNGIGIKDNYKYKIFEIYESSTQNLGGAGMGLYIVKTRLESIKGSISLIENIYKPLGATFKIIIPVNK